MSAQAFFRGIFVLYYFFVCATFAKNISIYARSFEIRKPVCTSHVKVLWWRFLFFSFLYHKSKTLCVIYIISISYFYFSNIFWMMISDSPIAYTEFLFSFAFFIVRILENKYINRNYTNMFFFCLISLRQQQSVYVCRLDEKKSGKCDRFMHEVTL